jgi:aspartyl/asparaginyl-tRNA synthetase
MAASAGHGDGDLRPAGKPLIMIPRISISEAARHVGETVEIAGWLYNLRKSGKIAFPIVRDGTGTMQCVAVKSALPEEAVRRPSRI